MCIRATKSRIPDFERVCAQQDLFKYKRDGSIPPEGYEIMKQEEIKWRNRFYENWCETLLNATPYKKPGMLGGKDIMEFINRRVDVEKNKVHVGFYFVKPGRQYYVIRH